MPPVDRYEGRPLLLLVENYVLSAIGFLAPDSEQKVASVTQRVFGGGADWRSTVRSTLRLGDSLDQGLLQMWAKNQKIAKDAGVTLSPEDFARMVADTNFAHLIPPASDNLNGTRLTAAEPGTLDSLERIDAAPGSN
jgi:hypothetical protein